MLTTTQNPTEDPIQCICLLVPRAYSLINQWLISTIYISKQLTLTDIQLANQIFLWRPCERQLQISWELPETVIILSLTLQSYLIQPVSWKSVKVCHLYLTNLYAFRGIKQRGMDVSYVCVCCRVCHKHMVQMFHLPPKSLIPQIQNLHNNLKYINNNTKKNFCINVNLCHLL